MRSRYFITHLRDVESISDPGDEARPERRRRGSRTRGDRVDPSSRCWLPGVDKRTVVANRNEAHAQAGNPGCAVEDLCKTTIRSGLITRAIFRFWIFGLAVGHNSSTRRDADTAGESKEHQKGRSLAERAVCVGVQFGCSLSIWELPLAAGLEGPKHRLAEKLDRSESASQRILAVFDTYIDSATASGHRGCVFLNAAAEIPGRDHPARAVVGSHKDSVRGFLVDQAEELGTPDPQQLGE